MDKRPADKDFEQYREERRIANKELKIRLKGTKDEKQGPHSTRYNVRKQIAKYVAVGWSELAPNQNKFLELLEQISNEGRENTHRDDIQPGGNGGESLPVSDAEPVVAEAPRG